jgi:hypothetical protein
MTRWFSGVTLTAALLVTAPATLLRAQGPGGGPKVIEEGQPPVVIHGVLGNHAAGHGGGAGTSSNLKYHGGTNDGSAGTVGVETAPEVVLVLWGSQWSNDPSGEAGILTNFFNNVGGSTWLATVTQYCEGVPSGTVFCSGTGTAAGNPPNMLSMRIWRDSASAAPSRPSQSQLAAEAVKAAAYFGLTTAAKNANVQYVIATAHGNNSSGFGTQYCAWHSATSSSYGDIAYTNLPYITDAGAACGANFNGLGATAGITIVEGHEMAETITDPFPSSGWLDGSGAEIGDKCAWNSGTALVAIGSASFPVQPLWSNAANSKAGGCIQ